MKNHRRADRVRMCNIVADRPGIIQPFMVPTKLKNQVRHGAQTDRLRFTPDGKTLVGGVQWAIRDQSRPGIATSLITAKAEQKALAKGMAVEAALASPQAKAKAKAQAQAAAAQSAKTQAASAEAEKSGGMSGYGYRW